MDAFLPPPLEIPVRNWLDAQALHHGIPVNSGRLVIGLVLSCLVAPFTHLVHGLTARHLCNVVLGMSLAIFAFDWMVIHSFLPTLLTYVILHVAPRSMVGTIVAIMTFAHLIYSHILREYYGADIIWDCAQMVLTLKLVGTAISYGDGALPAAAKTPAMLRNQLLAVPSLLELFGYVYFFPSFLVGPVFEFSDYTAWVEANRIAPVVVVLRNLGFLVLSIAGYVLSQMYFPIGQVTASTFYPTLPAWARWLMQLGCVGMYKYTFFMVWQFGELGGVLAGYGYNPATKDWDGLRNNNIFLVEVPTSTRVMINNWNIKVAAWLNTYVYQRVGLTKDGKPTAVSTFASFLVSALWHGLLPGYYFFFIFMGLTLEVGRQMRRRVRATFHYTEDRNGHPHAIFTEYFDSSKAHPLALLYDVAGVLLAHFFTNYFGMAFANNNMQTFLAVWSTVYYIPHVFILCLFVVFSLTEPKKPKAKTG
ncbi:Aste57867_8674 [Aphanomyces stellatus]|uniref:Aste57867_8674 protein n=1 Tax=Aphanomyces stellatus TaxID=120398 RepID=A0A485KL16_9STRA|nr:hypothetical protein As57867_008640 [Aphanomyces stellatus]VFT85560.1 Aste57867_8674 [Aphanomyces stellatus]